MLAERTWFAYRCISAVICELVSFVNGAFDQRMKRSRSFHSSGGNERSCISDPGVAWGRDNPRGPLDRCELTHSAETWSDRGKLRAGQKHTHTHRLKDQAGELVIIHLLKHFIMENYFSLLFWELVLWRLCQIKTSFSLQPKHVWKLPKTLMKTKSWWWHHNHGLITIWPLMFTYKQLFNNTMHLDEWTMLIHRRSYQVLYMSS